MNTFLSWWPGVGREGAGGRGGVWDYNDDLLVPTLLSGLPGSGHLPPRCLGLSAEQVTSR